MLRSTSATKAVISLSSGESECYALMKGTSAGLGAVSMSKCGFESSHKTAKSIPQESLVPQPQPILEPNTLMEARFEKKKCRCYIRDGRSGIALREIFHLDDAVDLETHTGADTIEHWRTNRCKSRVSDCDRAHDDSKMENDRSP